MTIRLCRVAYSWPVCAMSSSIKTEVYDVSQRRQRKTMPRPQAQNLGKIGRVVPEIYSRTDRHAHTQTKQTNRHTSQYFTSLLCGGGVVTQMASDRCTLHKRLKKVLEKLQGAFWRPGLRLICYHRMKRERERERERRERERNLLTTSK